MLKKENVLLLYDLFAFICMLVVFFLLQWSLE